MPKLPDAIGESFPNHPRGLRLALGPGSVTRSCRGKISERMPPHRNGCPRAGFASPSDGSDKHRYKPALPSAYWESSVFGCLREQPASAGNGRRGPWRCTRVAIGLLVDILAVCTNRRLSPGVQVQQAS